MQHAHAHANRISIFAFLLILQVHYPHIVTLLLLLLHCRCYSRHLSIAPRERILQMQALAFSHLPTHLSTCLLVCVCLGIAKLQVHLQTLNSLLFLFTVSYSTLGWKHYTLIQSQNTVKKKMRMEKKLHNNNNNRHFSGQFTFVCVLCVHVCIVSVSSAPNPVNSFIFNCGVMSINLNVSTAYTHTHAHILQRIEQITPIG